MPQSILPLVNAELASLDNLVVGEACFNQDKSFFRMVFLTGSERQKIQLRIAASTLERNGLTKDFINLSQSSKVDDILISKNFASAHIKLGSQSYVLHIDNDSDRLSVRKKWADANLQLIRKIEVGKTRPTRSITFYFAQRATQAHSSLKWRGALRECIGQEVVKAIHIADGIMHWTLKQKKGDIVSETTLFIDGIWRLRQDNHLMLSNMAEDFFGTHKERFLMIEDFVDSLVGQTIINISIEPDCSVAFSFSNKETCIVMPEKWGIVGVSQHNINRKTHVAQFIHNELSESGRFWEHSVVEEFASG